MRANFRWLRLVAPLLAGLACAWVGAPAARAATSADRPSGTANAAPSDRPTGTTVAPKRSSSSTQSSRPTA